MKQLFDLVDFHAHILPGADHGSSSLSVTESQLDLAWKYGIKRIIATPHFYPTVHSVDEFLLRRENAYSKLLSLEKAVEVKLGAEVLICNGIENLPGLDKLFISGTKALLLELPFSDFQEEYCDSVYELLSKGVSVILAHADRYPKENIEKIVSLGAKIQLNTDSLLGLFKKKHLYDWLERGLVCALGSDIHGVEKKYYYNFTKAVRKISRYAENIKIESDKIFEASFSE